MIGKKQHPPPILWDKQKKRLRLLGLSIACFVGIALIWMDARYLQKNDLPWRMQILDRHKSQVAQVRHGDVLVLYAPTISEQLVTVRIIGIQASSLTRGRPFPQPIEQQAKAWITQQTAGEEVELLIEATATRDRSQRLMGHIILPDGASLGLSLIQQGLAQTDREHSHRDVALFEQAQYEARQAKLGLWGN